MPHDPEWPHRGPMPGPWWLLGERVVSWGVTLLAVVGLALVLLVVVPLEVSWRLPGWVWRRELRAFLHALVGWISQQWTRWRRGRP